MTQAQNPARDRRLATILKLDAAFCAACALPALVAPNWLSAFLLPGTPTLLGWPMATIVMEAGILLALSAAVLVLIATRPMVSRPLAMLSAGVDAALVAGTLLLLAVAGDAFSLAGIFVLMIVAVDTALIAGFKLCALRRNPALAAIA